MKWPLMIRRVSGHSMMPVLPPGTMVYARRWVLRLRPGVVVILHHNGMEKIKRIHHIAGDDVYVIGDHPDTSTDSRHFGPISRSAIMAVVIYPRVQIMKL